MTNDTPVEIVLGTDNASLILRPVLNKKENKKLFDKSLKEGNKRYGKAMKKLADK